MMSSTRCGAIIVPPLLAACLTLACGTAERGPGPGYFGRWEVIGFDMPGFHALSAEESQALVGTEAFFSEGEASFGDRGCRPPAYDERDVELADFGSEYRLDPALLDLSDPVQLVDVGCAAAWSGPGSLLILRADGSLLTVWEGVFFELARVDP